MTSNPQPDRPFRDEPTEVLQAALDLASTHAQQAARFRPQDQGAALPAVAGLFQAELQHREGQTPADEAEELVHVGWWCWRGDNHGHLATQACRSDNVPIHVPAEWADEMRAVIQRIEDGDDAPAPVAQQPAVEAEQDDTVHACPGRWGGPNCRCFDAEPAPGEQQAAAADDEETPSRAVLLDLVRDFLDPDPCSFDHHGYCQAHGYLGGEPGSCPHGRARKLIPGIDDEPPTP